MAEPVKDPAKPAPVHETEPPLRRSGPRPLAEALAFLLPLIGVLSQIRGDALFRSDAAVLAVLDGQHSFQGAFSQWAMEPARALPLGNQIFRMSLLGAIFAGVAGWALLRLCHALFRKQGGYSRLDPWLALGASLSASFSLPWLSEATVAGGAAVGAGLTLLLIAQLAERGLPRTSFEAMWGGVLLGALTTESRWTAGLVVVSALLLWPDPSSTLALPRRRVGPTQRARLLLSALCSAILCAALLWLPALQSQSAVAIDALGTHEESMWPLWSPLPWIASIGFLWTGGALFAFLFSLKDRRMLAALALFVILDWVVPGSSVGGWTQALDVDENRLVLHLSALALVAPLGALGLRTLGETAEAMRLYAARPLAAMVAVLAIAGCFASAEDSLRRLNQQGSAGAQAWTDEALYALPDRAIVLTQSAAWGRRLLAAQALSQRPDVLIVPLADVTRPARIQSWLEAEARLEILLRDLSLAETPSERAMTELVDQRPVFLEADPNWDRRILEHLQPSIPLAAFSPHALGRSDRLAALDTVATPRDRIVAASREGLVEEPVTRDVLSLSFTRTLAVLEAVKDGPSQRRLEELFPAQSTSEDGDPKQLAPIAALDTQGTEHQ